MTPRPRASSRVSLTSSAALEARTKDSQRQGPQYPSAASWARLPRSFGAGDELGRAEIRLRDAAGALERAPARYSSVIPVIEVCRSRPEQYSLLIAQANISSAGRGEATMVTRRRRSARNNTKPSRRDRERPSRETWRSGRRAAPPTGKARRGPMHCGPAR